MTLTRLALTLALGGIAANLYMKSRRQAYTMTTEPAEDGTAPWRETSPADSQTAAASEDSDFMPQTTSSLAASDSPNGAERLEEAG
ncbi:MAG: hypothetical protein JWQ88_3727, partial [Rhodoferax sp.]|nr:hypothetical protein [Rhodoferax sp.]